jgi:hypothetical protein
MSGGGGQLFGRGAPFLHGGGVDSGVTVLAIVLRFTIWVLVILAAVWFLRELFATIRAGRPSAPPLASPAMAELEMLYARGEVSRADYLSRRADLAGIPAPVPPPA